MSICLSTENNSAIDNNTVHDTHRVCVVCGGKQQDLNQKTKFMLVGGQFLKFLWKFYLITCFKGVWYG